MGGKRTAVGIPVGLLLALFVLSFALDSLACEQQLAVYFFAGVAVLLAVAVAPWVLPGPGIVASRLGAAFLLGGACVLVWIAGLFAGDVRIICRLF